MEIAGISKDKDISSIISSSGTLDKSTAGQVLISANISEQKNVGFFKVDYDRATGKFTSSEMQMDEKYNFTKVIPVKNNIVYTELTLDDTAKLGFCGMDWFNGTSPYKVTVACQFAKRKESSNSYSKATQIGFSSNSMDSFTTIFGEVNSKNPLDYKPQFLQESSFTLEDGAIKMNNVVIYSGRTQYFQLAVSGKESSWFSKGSTISRRFNEDSVIQFNVLKSGNDTKEIKTFSALFSASNEKIPNKLSCTGLLKYKGNLFSLPDIQIPLNKYEYFTNENIILPIDRNNFKANGIYIEVVSKTQENKVRALQ